jgi:putative peptide zinc metalloprotease protein
MRAAERPRLAPGLKFVRHQNDAGISWVVKDPATRKYFRFGQLEAWVMQQLDGSNTLQDVCDALAAETGVRATTASLDVLVRRLKEVGLVERSGTERSALLMEQLRTQRRIRRESDNTLLRMRFSFGDPDVLLARLSDRFAFMFTTSFVAVSAAFFALYLVIIVAWWAPFSAMMAALYNPASLTLSALSLTWVVFAVVALIHELGHGVACKRFGGSVHELGAMSLYFMPAFYCNISDAWTFEKRAHRLWVTFAGGWVQLWIAGVAAIIWLLTEPGTWISTVAAVTTASAGALALLLNYNPLLPLDGYYALVDWLEMPNLRGRSFGYLGAVLKRYVLRLDVPVPQVTARERRILMAYGLLAAAYTSAILAIVALFAGRFLITRLHWWGVLLTLLLLLGVTWGPRATAAMLARRVIAEKLPRGPRLRRAATWLAVASLIVVAAAAAAPWTVRTPARVLVEPAARTWVRPARDARLAEVRVVDGMSVQAGDTLAVLRDPRLDLELVRATARVRVLERVGAAARSRGDAASARAAEMEQATMRDRLAALQQQRDELVLRAPGAGVLATPLLDERVGAMIAAGDSLLELWQPGPPRARLVVPAGRGGEVRAGATLRVRFPAYPGLTWHGTIERVETAADGTVLHAIASIPEHPAHPLLPGMLGRGRIDVARTTVGGAAVRNIRRLKRLELLL